MSFSRTVLFAAVGLSACQQAPEISDLAVYTEDFSAGIAFLAEDPNADLDGGTVFLDFDGHKVEYPLFSDDPAAERRGTIVALGYRYPACAAGGNATVGITVADAEGGLSNALVTTVSLKGDVLDESEPNDDDSTMDRFTYSSGSAAAICGELDRTGLDANDYYREGDLFEFYSQVSGQRTIVLQAAPETFFDLWHFDEDFDEKHAFAEEFDPVGGFRWVTLDVTVRSGEYFYVYVAAASGPTGEYSLFLE